MFVSPGSRARARPYRAAQKTRIIAYNAAGYTVVAQDSASELILGGGFFFTVKLGPPSDYPPGFNVTLVNDDNQRGKTISPSGSASFILWPNQTVTAYVSNQDMWNFSPASQRWRLPGNTNFYVDPTNGSDSNDGLVVGAGAFATIGQAAANIYSNIDCGGNQPQINVAAGATVKESVGVFGNPVGHHVFSVLGVSSAPFTWNPSSSLAGDCLEVGDNAQFIVGNVTFSASNNSNAGYCHVLGHQWGVIEFNAVTFGSAGNTGQGNDVQNDSSTHINFINGATLTGARLNHVFLTNGHLDYNGTVTLSTAGAVAFAMNQMFAFQGVTYAIVEGNVTFVNSSLATGRGFAVTGNSIFVNVSGSSIPGTSSGVTTTGGQYSVSAI
jgi:hypothetical protein